VVDLAAGTVAALRAYRKQRGAMALQLVAGDALVFGRIEGGHRNPKHASRQFVSDVARCRKASARTCRRRSGCTTCGRRTRRSC
jgi:hypothetical protein